MLATVLQTKEPNSVLKGSVGFSFKEALKTFARLSGFEHQLAPSNRLFGCEDGLNDAINVERHFALERFIVAIRAT